MLSHLVLEGPEGAGIIQPLHLLVHVHPCFSSVDRSFARFLPFFLGPYCARPLLPFGGVPLPSPSTSQGGYLLQVWRLYWIYTT